MKSNVLYVQNTTAKQQGESSGAIMSAVESGAVGDVAADVQEGTLLYIHQRGAHLAFDTIKRMASDPSSGKRLTSHRRMACVSCMEGKQTRNVQPQQDSSENAPMDRIGGVICLSLKGSDGASR
uniref:Uncharacterized protein n=1 Tax=Peronospora matthiolae TaxID=2874970 RepID=A0AAV1U5U4_9STRA